MGDRFFLVRRKKRSTETVVVHAGRERNIWTKIMILPPRRSAVEETATMMGKGKFKKNMCTSNYLSNTHSTIHVRHTIRATPLLPRESLLAETIQQNGSRRFEPLKVWLESVAFKASHNPNDHNVGLHC